MKIYQKFLFGASAVCAMVFAGCTSGNKEVEEFALSFANKAAANQLDSVRAIYPDAEKADSLSLSFVADSITVAEGDAANTFLVNYGKASITVKRDDNGKFSVVSSKGIFAYPEQRMTFAKKTGTVKDEMDDIEIASNISQLDSVSVWIYDEYKKSLDGAITAGKPVVTQNIQFMMDTGEGYILLTNNTDRDIAGKDYQIRWKFSYMGMAGESTSYDTRSGKDVAAHQSVKVPFYFTGHDYMEIVAINVKGMSMDEYLSTYEPTGDEYANYKKSLK
jgi:hypothetical protein